MSAEDACEQEWGSLTVRNLLGLWSGSLRELRARGIVRTYNSPIGDIAEELVAQHYRGERAGPSQKTWDVRVGSDLLQVKAVRRTNPAQSLQLSPIRSEGGYTAVIAVVFTEDLRVDYAVRLPRELVNATTVIDGHVNGRRVRLTTRLLDDPAVERLDLTTDALDG